MSLHPELLHFHLLPLLLDLSRYYNEAPETMSSESGTSNALTPGTCCYYLRGYPSLYLWIALAFLDPQQMTRSSS